MPTSVCIEHANSIAVIPEEVFPDRAARLHLIMRAIAGEDVYAYQPAGSDRWVLWIYDGNPGHENRWSIEQYTEQFNLEKEKEVE